MVKNKRGESHSKSYSKDSILIENLISLQKVTTNLYVKIDELTGQISKLLNLFETSAKEIAKKDFEIGGIDNKTMGEFTKKMDNLLEQNKIIARGIALLHEPAKQDFPQQTNSPQPFEGAPIRPIRTGNIPEKYQKSIFSSPSDNSIETNPPQSSQQRPTQNPPTQFSQQKELIKKEEIP